MNTNSFVESVRAQLAPVARGSATANTLEQLFQLLPSDITLSDIALGWRLVANGPMQESDPALAARRTTCQQLAQIAGEAEPGNRTQAIAAWTIWQQAFAESGDPRQAAMAKTFARELAELQ